MEFLDINGQYEYFKAINVYLDGDLAVNDKSTSVLVESLHTSMEEGNMTLTQMLFTMLLNNQQVNDSNDTSNQLLSEINNKDNTTDLTPLVQAINNKQNTLDLTPIVEAINNFVPVVVVQNDQLTEDMKRWMVMIHQVSIQSVLLADKFNQCMEKSRLQKSVEYSRNVKRIKNKYNK